LAASFEWIFTLPARAMIEVGDQDGNAARPIRFFPLIPHGSVLVVVEFVEFLAARFTDSVSATTFTSELAAALKLSDG